MSGDDRAFKRAQQNGTILDETAEEMRAQLANILALEEIDRVVLDVQIFGRGPTASVDVQLSGDLKLTFDRFGDITKPPALTSHLASIGVAKTFKGGEAALAGALVSRLAKHHESESEESIAREWGSEFLRLAPTQDVDLGDQADRWRAFASIESRNPAKDAGDDRSAYTYAQACVVLVDKTSGTRLIRCGWLLGYVKREAGSIYSPERLGTLMDRVGWQRSGRDGRVKATSPTLPRTLNWRFYSVPKGWEHS